MRKNLNLSGQCVYMCTLLGLQHAGDQCACSGRNREASDAAGADWSMFEAEEARRRPIPRPPGAATPARVSETRDPTLRGPEQWELAATTGRRTVQDYNTFLRKLSFKECASPPGSLLSGNNDSIN